MMINSIIDIPFGRKTLDTIAIRHVKISVIGVLRGFGCCISMNRVVNDAIHMTMGSRVRNMIGVGGVVMI